MSGDADLVRALVPLAEAIPLARAALTGGALRLGQARTSNPPRTTLVQITRADGTPVGSSRPLSSDTGRDDGDPGRRTPDIGRERTDTGPRTSDVGHAGAHCDLCHESIATGHAHLIDVTDHSLHCVCRACALLFTPKGAGTGRFRAVPDRYEQLEADADGPWLTMEVPVGLAFFIRAENGELAAFYPSPAGATQSALSIDSWQDLAARAPRLATLEPEVEALLVRQLHGRRDAFIVPVDVCYELVGIVRRDWRGFDGGRAVRSAIDERFDRMRARSLASREGVSA
jgi:hypothetical protein